MKNKTKHLQGMLAVVGAVLVGASAAYGQSATIEPIAGYTSSTFLDWEAIEQPGGLVPVVVTFTKPLTTGQTTLGLRCRLTLPAGWTVDDGTFDGNGPYMTYTGTGTFNPGPELQPDGISFVCTGSFGTTAQQAAARTFSLRFSLYVPQGQTGQKSLRAEWGYYFSAMPGEAWLFATEDPTLIEDLNPPALTPPRFGDDNTVSVVGGRVDFTLSTTNGHAYRIVYKNDLLDPGPWTNPVTPPLPAGWVSGTGGPIMITDTNVAGVALRFYRIQERLE